MVGQDLVLASILDGVVPHRVVHAHGGGEVCCVLGDGCVYSDGGSVFRVSC